MQPKHVGSRHYIQMEESIAYLIEACRRGNKTAQMALYKKYAGRLYSACLRIIGNKAEAEEAMQDSFLKVFTRMDQYKDEQNFEAWIHRIAIHTSIDYFRRQTQEWDELSSNFAEPAEEEEPDEDEIQYAVAQVKEATRKLSDGYRIVLTLYLFEGYDMEEIASILKIQPSSVRTQYLRGKRKLLEMITTH
jgi:RNA polymerase sigma-70 factor (ECF subfamily)